MLRTFLSARLLKILIANLALAALGGFVAQAANAGCGDFGSAKAKPTADWRSYESLGTPRFTHAEYRRVSDEEGSLWDYHFDHAIVGLWHFEYTSKGNSGIPDGTPIDGGNTTWYNDGNELTSSEMRAPDTGSICLGVWRQTGKYSYELNHIGLSWDPVNNVFVGPAFIKQYVTLQPGFNAYSGTFTITQYKADGTTVQVVIKGLIAATRVTLDTTTQPSP